MAERENGKEVRSMITKLVKFFKDEEGTEVVEWALILVLIIVLTIVAIRAVGTNTSLAWQSAADNLKP